MEDINKTITNQRHHPMVQVAYNYTLPWFANIIVSVGMVLGMPIAQLAVFNLFNNWNPWTIVWSAIIWLMSVYSTFLIVGSEVMQAYLLWINLYVKGWA